MIVKYVSKMVADRYGQTATFMPKPLFGEAGSGMHFHQHLFRDGVNLFYDADGYGLLSDTARWYIGGLLLHAPALLGLTNPSTNSYRRLVPGFEAPVRTFFSLANRSAAVRVPKYATTPDTVRIEFRPPDATGNLYLSMAAQLMAGIDGIRRKIDPTEHGFGPIDENVFASPPSRPPASASCPPASTRPSRPWPTTTRSSWRATSSAPSSWSAGSGPSGSGTSRRSGPAAPVRDEAVLRYVVGSPCGVPRWSARWRGPRWSAGLAVSPRGT
jgi:hypothetical protein